MTLKSISLDPIRLPPDTHPGVVDELRRTKQYVRYLVDGLANTDDTNLGDANIGVKRTETGAVATTQHDVNQWGEVNALHFMSEAERADVIAGTLLVDVFAALQKAMDAVNTYAFGGTLIIPGHCKITDTLTYSNKPLVIRGLGRDVSSIRQYTAGKSILSFSATTSNRLASNGVFKTLEVQGLGLYANVAGATSAVVASWVDDNTPETFLTVRDVRCGWVDNTTYYFVRNFDLTDCNGSRWDSVFITGDPQSSSDAVNENPYSSTDGIKFSGVATNVTSNHMFNKLWIGAVNNALHFATWTEGIYLNNFEFVNVGYGVRHTSNGLSIQISDGHATVRGRLLDVGTLVSGVGVSNVDTQHGQPLSGNKAFGACISMQGGESLTVEGCRLRGPSKTSSTAVDAISITDISRVSILGNRFNDYAGACINGGAGTITSVSVDNNTFDEVVTGVDFSSATVANSQLGMSNVWRNVTNDTLPTTLIGYKTGTWTPVLTFTTPGDLSVAYSAQAGFYTKVGRTVTVTFVVNTSTFTHTTASGDLQLTGLPFANLATSNSGSKGSTFWQGITKASYTHVVVSATSGASSLRFVASGSGQSASNVVAADMPTGGTVQLNGTITYHTTQ